VAYEPLGVAPRDIGLAAGAVLAQSASGFACAPSAWG